jgi:hypothetical protein
MLLVTIPMSMALLITSTVIAGLQWDCCSVKAL